MLTSFTLVKAKPGFSRDEFFRLWCEHTLDYDLRDHPEISLNRLILFEGGAEFVGIAENHWPDRASLERAAAWYATPAGRTHQRDLERFMDIENSPTVIVTHEANVSSEGIEFGPAPGSR